MTVLFKSRSRSVPVAAGRRLCLTNVSPGVLRRWNEPGVGLVVWQRTWTGTVTERLDLLQLSDMPRARFIARAADAEASVAAGLADVACSDALVLEALAADIEALVARYAEVSECPLIEVRLEAISGNACRLFHVDRTRSRLVTTYVGPGTEWVPDASSQAALHDSENYDGPVERLPRFAVAILPGSLSDSGGLVHRSPPIVGTGQVRLFLCMTAVPG